MSVQHKGKNMNVCKRVSWFVFIILVTLSLVNCLGDRNNPYDMDAGNYNGAVLLNTVASMQPTEGPAAAPVFSQATRNLFIRFICLSYLDNTQCGYLLYHRWIYAYSIFP
jgi:hypothetical protein